ncbi:glycoside hydrolase [Leeia sp.]|uniref:glycoside hydrolase n=1 Tax=Leeia sp. TaxID=2884678 RepID=UPI0035B36E30
MRIRYLAGLLWLATSSTWAEVLLSNAQWQIRVDPATLAMQVIPAGGDRIVVSQGQKVAQDISGLKQDQQQASWRWPGFQWTMTLRGADLNLSVQADKASTLSWLQQPASAMGRGMVLPLGEGGYVPAGHTGWQSLIMSQYAEMDSTESLSLPLWGLDHGKWGLHWILTNPYHNTLQWSADGKGLALNVSHQFSVLGERKPMTATLHLEQGDVLAGAKWYRNWLQSQGLVEGLADKLKQQPEGRKLIGASHIYLWGGGLLASKDVQDWPTWVGQLKGGGPLSQAVRAKLSADALQLLAQWPATADGYQKRTLVAAVNEALYSMARQNWQQETMDMAAIAPAYSRLRQQAEQEWGAALAAPAQWGGGVSTATVKRLQQAGLARLWLGLDSWEGGLWHPEAIRSAVAAGYLIGPYDSYETALPHGTEPDWNSAHLGQDAYTRCAIIKANGQAKSGFKGSGHYTNPDCVRPLLQARVQQLKAAAGFNSWFLDAYAAGMLFDDHAASRKQDQSAVAAGYVTSQRWLGQQLPLGSEGGNAVTASGILFAHGMQTTVFGWGDKALKDKTSPYYLGRYYPAEQPEVFFKAVPVKEPYRSTLFEPANRLPLYQTVFHGALISSHHWSADNLKFQGEVQRRILLNLLYNVPPMLHLSEATLGSRLPLLQKLDSVFRPQHEQLATQRMTAFRWLSPDRLVQQTTFEDGSTLTANFGAQAAQVEGGSVPAGSLRVRMSGKREVMYTP